MARVQSKASHSTDHNDELLVPRMNGFVRSRPSDWALPARQLQSRAIGSASLRTGPANKASTVQTISHQPSAVSRERSWLSAESIE